MNEPPNIAPVGQIGSDWRARLKELGKRAFELAEMERLGFWPTDPETTQRTAALRAELEEIARQIARSVPANANWNATSPKSVICKL